MKVLVIDDLLRKSWAPMKDDLPLIAGLSAVYAFAAWVIHFIPFANVIVFGPLGAGYLYSLLQIQKKETIGYKDFFWGFMDLNRFLHLVVLNVLATLAITIGYILLIIPGVWLTVSLFFGTTIFVTTKQDGVEALRMSMDLVKGRWWQCAWFLFVLCVLNIVGALCLMVGLLVTAPLSVYATVLAMQKLVASRAEVSTPTPPPAENVTPLS